MSKPSLRKSMPLQTEMMSPKNEVVELSAAKQGNSLTILCVDIYQSTSQISQMDVEDAREWMEPTIEVMSQAMKKYNGIIHEFTGDGLVAFFRGDQHQLRGCFAALLLQKLLQAMKTHRCHARVGVHSVQIDEKESDKVWLEKKNITIVQKIQDYAPVDGVIVSGACYDDLAELLIVGNAQEIILEDKTRLVCYFLLHLSKLAEKAMKSFHVQQSSTITSEEKEITNESSLPGERKYVTSMFIKLIAEKASQLKKAMVAVEEIITHFDGFVLKKPGDTLYAIFGAPISIEEHPLRACLAANAIREKIIGEGTSSVSMRIGLNSGEVVIDDIGGKSFHQYDVIGASVNLAARMMQTADINQIQLSKYTSDMVKAYVDLASLGSKAIKGFNKPVSTYALTGIKTHSIREYLEKSIYIKTPFVGRKKELKELLKVYHDVQRNQGCMLGINAEAGLGKSRMAFEFSQLTEKHGAMAREFSASVYEQKESFSALKKLLMSLFSIEATVINKQQEKILLEQLAKLRFSEKFALESLLTLLSIDVDNREWNNTPAIIQKKVMFTSLSECLVQLSRKKPLILILDDGQWCDEETLNFLKNIPSMVKEQAIMFIFNHRTEFSFHECFGTELKDIDLNPLDAVICKELTEQLLPGDKGITEVRERVVSLSEGSPFLIQEYINMLVDNGDVLLNKDGTYSTSRKLKLNKMPLSVRGVVTARIDRLSPKEKRLLLQASILGKTFPLSFLEYIRDDDKKEGQFKEMLAVLADKGFIHELAPLPEPEYTFIHNYICEVAYDVLLKKDKQEYHAKLVASIEKHKKAHLKNYYTILAHHSQAGALWGKAIYYYDIIIPSIPTIHFPAPQYIVTGHDARYCFEQLAAQEKKRHFSLYAHTQMMYVYGLFLSNQTEQMVEALGSLEQENSVYNDAVVSIAIKLWFGLFSFFSNQCHAGMQLFTDIVPLYNKAKKLLTPEKSTLLFLDINLILAHLTWPVGEFQRFDEHYKVIADSNLDFLDEGSPFIGSSAKVVALLHSSYRHLICANISDMKITNQMVEKTLKAGLPASETSILLNIYSATYHYAYGNLNKACQYILTAAKQTEEVQLDAAPFIVFPLAVSILAYLDDTEQALFYATLYKEILQSQHYALGIGAMTLLVIEVFARYGKLEDAWEILNNIKPFIEADDQKPILAQCYYTEAFLHNLAATDNSRDEEILSLLNQSMEITNEFGCNRHYPYIELVYAEFYQRLGNKQEQKKHYQQALDYFKQYGMKGWYDYYKSRPIV